MNVNEIINNIKEVALTQETVKSVYDGDVYENWNSTEVNYGSVNIGIQNVSNDGNNTTFSVILYYGDRLMQDRKNKNSVFSDGINTLQTIINILHFSNYFSIDTPITYTPFEQEFMDYLGGVYCQIDITAESELGYCSLDNYVYIDDKDKLIEELIEQINKYKTEDEELTLLLQEILHKINGETFDE